MHGAAADRRGSAIRQRSLVVYPCRAPEVAPPTAKAERRPIASALTQTKGAAEVSPAFAKPTKNLGGSDGGRAQGIVVRESFECVCALDCDLQLTRGQILGFL